MLLGEARSKCEHLAGVPLRPETAAELYRVFLAKGAFATTSIEGNTLSEEEVRLRLEGKLALPKSREYLGREVDNVIEACSEIFQDVVEGHPLELTPERIKHFNRLVLQGLEVDEDTVPGEFRHHRVGVGPSYLGAPAEDCEYLVARLCEWLNGDDWITDDDDMAFALVVTKAVLAHLYLAWIHPFGDGNGRTARLVEFQMLVQSGRVPMPAGHLLSNHYNLTRDRYYHQLQRASRSGGEIGPFLEYAVQGFVDGLREALALVREQQWDVAWENYVHSSFAGPTTPTHSRRKHLMLDMPWGPVARHDLRRVSPRVAEEYATKGDRTLSRDLNALEDMGLIRRRGRDYVANRSRILAFLPPLADPEAAQRS